MNLATFKGQITKLECKAGTTKLTIEMGADKSNLDVIKLLLDMDVDICISDNQTTLTVEYPISEDKNVTITANGGKLLEKAKEILET